MTSPDLRSPAVADPESVNAAELRALMRAWRQGRATQTVRDVISDGYVGLFMALVLVVPVVNVLLELQKGSAGCTSDGCLTARGVAPWLALSLVSLAALGVARLFGPVTSSAPEAFWLVGTPVHRGDLLRGRLWGVMAAISVPAAVVVGLVTGLAGSGWLTAGWWALAAGLTASGLISLAAAEQGAGRSSTVRGLRMLAGACTGTVLLIVIGVAAGWFALPVGAASARAAQLVSAVGLLASIAASVIARRRLDRLHRKDLVSGGELAQAMQGAFFGLDFGLMHDLVEERRWAAIGHVKVARGRGSGPTTLAWRDLQRLARNPRPLIGLAMSALVPYAVLALGGGRLVAPVSATVTMITLVPFLTGLRVLSRSRGLARGLPFTETKMRDALVQVPLALIVLWVAMILPALLMAQPITSSREIATAVFAASGIGFAALLGAIRWVSSQPPNFQVPMLATGAGAIPPSLVANLVRGIDMTLLITLPLLLGWPSWLSLLIAAAVWGVLRMGRFDLEDMQARSKQAQDDLGRAKADQHKTTGNQATGKTKRTPPQQRSNSTVPNPGKSRRSGAGGSKAVAVKRKRPNQPT